ncbi:MAG: hypothetical protein ACRC57_02555 [Sarcina sp.]
MSFINILWSNIKRLLKNTTIFMMMIVTPIVVAVAINVVGGANHNNKKEITLINNNFGIHSENLIELLKEEYSLSIIDEKFLDDSDIKQEPNFIIQLEDNYNEIIEKGILPKIIVRKMEESPNNIACILNIDLLVKTQLENIKMGENATYIKTKIINDDIFPSGIVTGMMLIYYSFLGSACIIEDMLKLKKANVIKRAITTANKDSKILFGLFGGAFVFSAISGSFVILLIKKFTNLLEGISLINAITAGVLSSFVFISIVIFSVRWFKNAQVVSVITTMSGVVALILGILGILGPYLFDEFEKLKILCYISPIYWAGEIMMGNIVAGSCVLILMAIAIFTTGSYRLREFATN